MRHGACTTCADTCTAKRDGGKEKPRRTGAKMLRRKITTACVADWVEATPRSIGSMPVRAVLVLDVDQANGCKVAPCRGCQIPFRRPPGRSPHMSHCRRGGFVNSLEWTRKKASRCREATARGDPLRGKHRGRNEPPEVCLRRMTSVPRARTHYTGVWPRSINELRNSTHSAL